MRSSAALLVLALALAAPTLATAQERDGRYEPYPRPWSPAGSAESQRVSTVLSLTAAAAPDGGAAGVALVLEGRRSGFQASIDAVGIEDVTDGPALDSTAAIGWGTMHATWAIASDAAMRLRFELGGSMLSMPDSGAISGRSYAGTVAFGPSVGLSGRIGLAGPLGFEGHARLTPVPVTVADARAALALRGGALAFTLGWRTIDVAGDGLDAPELRFSGVEVGLSLVF